MPAPAPLRPGACGDPIRHGRAFDRSPTPNGGGSMSQAAAELTGIKLVVLALAESHPDKPALARKFDFLVASFQAGLAGEPDGAPLPSAVREVVEKWRNALNDVPV